MCELAWIGFQIITIRENLPGQSRAEAACTVGPSASFFLRPPVREPVQGRVVGELPEVGAVRPHQP